MSKNYIYPFIILITFFFCTACNSSIKEIELNTEAEFGFPFLKGSYQLGDLFQDFEETTSLTIKPGVFHSISDTIPFTSPNLNFIFDSIELIFRTSNVMPFQVDLSLTPFDTISGQIIGEPIYITVVEAAWVEFDGLSLNPVYSENTLTLNKKLTEQLEQSNSLILDLDFIWPYEKITTNMIENYKQMFAFQLLVIMIINF